MNAALVDDTPINTIALSYDEDIAYEEQISEQPERSSLADRIGRTKVYLLSDASTLRGGKRKRGGTADEAETADTDADMQAEDDMSHRGNAILLQGSPISHLPTARIFAYATHFDAVPMGLEWVDDTTCVLVFETNASAHDASRLLQKNPDEYPDDEGFLTAKSIPMTFWPPEERINASLGKGEGLKGTIRMRWAIEGDVKKKGARKESQFYRKHGLDAGKIGEKRPGQPWQTEDVDELMPAKRRRREGDESVAHVRAQLDDDIETFLREDSPDYPVPEDTAPPSKMRSDYIQDGRKSLLERTSIMRAHDRDPPPDSLASRLTARLPRRARRRSDRGEEEIDSREVRGGSGRRSRGDGSTRRGQPREKKSQQELDDELEAFLNDRT